MNSNGSERRRTLEAPELLRSRDPPPGSILAALRRTESSLTHGAATPVHCRGMTLPAVGPAYCQLAVVIFPLAHGPQHPKRRLSWLKKTNLKRRTDERQNTQREKHATAQRQRAHVHSSHAAHAAGAPFAAHPAPNRAGRPCRALLYVPRGVNLDLNTNGGFRPAATPFGLEVGWRKLGEGRNSVVTFIVFLFPEGKRERGGSPEA